METIQAIKGMNDILPAEIGWWHRVEATVREVFESFGYREIRIPVMEKLELFARSIGESTDIVEKEMYSLPDSKGRWLALRPEATASIVRAFIEHNLQADPLLKKFYAMGPMFRHERPQKGRYRQFHQIDAEVFGIEDPMLDAEIMFMLTRFMDRLGVTGVRLHVNSLGCRKCRPVYRERLQAYLEQKADDLCPDCRRRRHVNPLRSFDCKVERCGEVIADAPLLLESICPDCADHFSRVQAYLDQLDTPYAVDPRMVRGLDYYMRTTFEVITDRLGAQNAVGGGGRYDGLMRDLGGPDLPGIGFAIGMERLILLLRQEQASELQGPDVFIAALGTAARDRAFIIAQQLRGANIGVEMDYADSSLKSQMRRAGKMGARHVLILGDEEIKNDSAPFRDMVAKSQREIPLGGIVASVLEQLKQQ